MCGHSHRNPNITPIIQHAVEGPPSAASPLNFTLDSILDNSDPPPPPPPPSPPPPQTCKQQHQLSSSQFSFFDFFASSPIPDEPDRPSCRHRHTGDFAHWPSRFSILQRLFVGTIQCPALPPVSFAMSLRSRTSVPAVPRVISPSPTPSELREIDDDAGPVTRSAARRRAATPQPMHGLSEGEESDEPGLRRARTRSRSPIDQRRPQRMTPRNTNEGLKRDGNADVPEKGNGVTRRKSNGHLKPPEPAAPSGWSWRDFSRSPSPLGLIPIHRHWRTFVHKHEVPRKILHVSIGFFVVWLYVTGTRTTAVPPYLMSAMIPIVTVEWLRHRFTSVNRFYVRCLGALMRESEYAGWNGVIFYLLGAWIVLFFYPKDVAVMSVLLLSWCDTAASTFGRLWGRYTPRIRRGKSMAGSLAAFVVGVSTSYFFWGWLVPLLGYMPGNETFMFHGHLTLPESISSAVGLSQEDATVTGSLALGIMGIVSGFVASASEVIDVFGWDDNLTIPVLSGIGILGFLKVFG